MNKELEKVCKEKSWKIIEPPCGAHYCCCSDDKFEDVFKQGFKAAIESEQVQGLVEAIDLALEQYTPGMTKTILSEALEKFRGEHD